MKSSDDLLLEREFAEAESERLRMRKKQRRRRRRMVVALIIMAGLLIALGKNLASQTKPVTKEESTASSNNYTIKAKIVDEVRRGEISARMRQFMAEVEQDFSEAGIAVTEFRLPSGTSREIHVQIEGRPEYYKLTMDRAAAVSVEDATRMMKYLDERELKPSYVDVRLEGRAYYK